jgi:hypothetical protein
MQACACKEEVMRNLVIVLAVLVSAGLGSTVIFSESFDSTWSTNSPPDSWRIFHTDTLNVGDDDWHRDSARTPWDVHPTPFAAILPSVTPDATPDSLVSPIIDCRGYKQVTVRCSTNFLPAVTIPYTAQIVYSVDSGATFPFVARTYYDTATGTIAESLVLDQARDRAGVVIAWVFDGDLNNITSWYVDDVQVTGDSLYLWDIQAGPIVVPGAGVTRTGPLSPTCRFRNLGDTIQYAIPVACSLYDNLGTGLAGWTSSIDSLQGGSAETVAVFAPAYALTPGDYSIKFWCYADPDYSRANDTVSANFQAVDLYDMAATAIVSPGAGVIRTGPLSPTCRFRNLGDTIQYAIPVACSLYDNLGTGLAGWTSSIDSLQGGSAETVAVFAPAYALTPGDYSIKFWCYADSDYNRANDTASADFRAVDLYDMGATAIVSPGASIMPGALTPSAQFRNFGDTVQYFVPVACTLYDNLMAVIAAWNDTIDSVPVAAETLIAFTPPFDISPGDYFIRFWCSADSDYNRANDTIGLSFRAASYDMATTAIVRPGAVVVPGPLTPTARFGNLGSLVQDSVPVACTLYNNLMVVIATWNDTIDSVPAAADTLLAFTPPFTVGPGDYFIRFWCSADSDYNRANDTLEMNFTAAAPSGDLLTETFDSTWTTSSPPFGWRIFHTDPLNQNSDDWHRRPAGYSPWINHPTPFAAIFQSATPDAPPDSLVSPPINCSGFKNVTLICSTYFLRFSIQSYTAQIRYSIDGGLTFPDSLTLRDYYLGSSNVPVRESLRLKYATNQADVRIAWVFDGDLGRIQFWYLDDVRVHGDPILHWDIACARIASPAAMVPPGLLTPRARFRNKGDSDQFNVPVACSLYDNLMNGLFFWPDTIDTLLGGDVEVEKFMNPPYPLALGDYHIKFWHESPADSVRSNDTLERDFTASMFSQVGYDDGQAARYRAWPVGHYGWGVKFDPGAPVYIESAMVYLAAPAAPAFCRYQLAILRDDGTGRPGPIYFKTPVLTATPADTGWNSVFLADSGEKLLVDTSFYLFYLQVGEPPECPGLGQDSASNSPTPYWQYLGGTFVQDTSAGDYMIRAWLNATTVTRPNYDVRTLCVDQPLYDFVRRPFNRLLIPQAHIENFGTVDLIGVPIPVTCSIFGSTGTLLYTFQRPVFNLNAGADTLIDFPPWVPNVSEPCSVIVSVYNMLLPDEIPDNDVKRFDCDVRKGVYSGASPLGYAWMDSDTTNGPVYSWIDTTGFPNVPLNLRDEDKINIPTYFNFKYYDSTYNYVYVSANGWFSLGTRNPGETLNNVPRKIPDTRLPNLALYPYWDDLAMGPGFGGGHLYYKTAGNPPNRYFVLIWQDVNRVGTDTTNGLSFEVIIHENGIFTFQYKDVKVGDPAFDYGRGTSIGLENGTGADGLNYLYAGPPMSTAVNDLENRLDSGRAINLYRQRRDVAALSIVTPADYSFPGQITPEVRIQNYGTVSDSIQVFVRIRPSTYAWFTTLGGLAPGESTTVSCSTWTAVPGSYTAVCSVAMAGDQDSTNNVASKYFIVAHWAQRPSIPEGWRRRKVQSGALSYAPTTKKLYALKGKNTNEFWRFDPATGIWDTLAPMPTEPSGSKTRDGCDLAFDPDIGDSGVLWALKGGGRTDFYYYDIGRDTWTSRRGVFVVDTHRIVLSRLPKKGAAIVYVPGHSAMGDVFCITGNNSNNFLRYDISRDTWNFAPDVPVQPLHKKKCKYGSDLAYNSDTDRVYVLKGSSTVEAYGYSFDPVRGDSWRDTLDVVSFLGPTRRTVRGGGCMTSLGGDLYALKGGNRQEFWRYQPAYDSWTRMSDIPLALTGHRTRPKRGAVLAAAESTIFCLKGSYSYEFWEYLALGDSYQPTLALPQPERQGVMALETRLDMSRPFLAVYPSPTRSGLVVDYNVMSPAHTRVRVYDATGKLVASVYDGPQLRGRHTFRWSGLGPRGQRPAAGVYFVKLESGDVRLAQKFVVQR